MSFDVDEDSIQDYTRFYNARQDSLSRVANRKLPKKKRKSKIL